MSRTTGQTTYAQPQLSMTFPPSGSLPHSLSLLLASLTEAVAADYLTSVESFGSELLEPVGAGGGSYAYAAEPPPTLAYTIVPPSTHPLPHTPQSAAAASVAGSGALDAGTAYIVKVVPYSEW